MSFKFPILVTCFLFTFVYILSVSSTFSIVLFNTPISTSKPVNDISFFFVLYFVSQLPYSRNSHGAITRQEGQQMTLSSSYSSFKVRRAKTRRKPTSSIFFQDQLTKTIQERNHN